MKLTRSIKRVWAYILVAALVVSSMVGYQAKSVSADVTDWSVIEYAGDGAGGGTYANLYKFYCDNENVSLVNIQAPGFASEAGLYVTTPAGISEVSVSSDIQGAGVILHLSAFTEKETLVTITDAMGTYTCYVYYENGVDGGEIETPTPTTEAPTTEAETGADGFIPLTTEEWVDMGAWTTYFGVSWANATGAYKGGATLNDFTLRVDSNNYSGYGIQAKATGLETVAGTTYKATVKFDSNVGGFSISSKMDGITDEVSYDVVAGANTIETIFVATAASTDIFFNLTGVPAGTTFTFSEVSVAEADKTPEMIEKERVEALFTSEDNLALNKTATASSAAAADAYLAKEAFDGNIQSRWAAGTFNEGEWIAVDLGAVYDITSVALAWEGAYATEYIIQVSEDGEAYTDALTVTATQAETLEKEITATGQYVRIYCVSNGLPYPYSIWEIAVLGTPVGGEEVTTEEVTTEEVTSEEVTTEEVTTEEVTTEEATTEEATTEEATSEEATSEEATSEEATSEEATSEEATSGEVTEGIILNSEALVDSDKVTYVGADWTWCNGELVYDSGMFVGDFVTTGGGWAGAEWGIQAGYENIAVEAGNTYTYTTPIMATQDMTIRVKVGYADDSEISYEEINLVAYEEYVYTKTFTVEQDSIKILFACAGGAEGATEDVMFVIGEYIEGEEETTEEPTEEPTDAPLIEGDALPLAWGEFFDNAGTAEITGTVEENTANLVITGFTTDYEWQADSIWQGQAPIDNIPVVAGQSYKFTMNMEASADKDILVQFESIYDYAYVESYTVNTADETVEIIITPHSTDAINIMIAFGATSADEAGTYDITLSDIRFVELVAEEETTTAEVETTTKTPETTTVAPTTKAPETTTVAPTTADDKKMKKPAKVTIKKVYAKKKAAKVVKVKFKKVKGATAYQVQISKAKKFTKKNILVNKKAVKKLKPSIKSKKLKNKKKLYVRVRAYVKTASGKKVYGKWSKVKTVKIK